MKYHPRQARARYFDSFDGAAAAAHFAIPVLPPISRRQGLQPRLSPRAGTWEPADRGALGSPAQNGNAAKGCDRSIPMSPRIPLDRDRLATFCRSWKISELALFGSVLRDDFRPDSDVDVLVTFSGGAQWSLFDLVKMEESLRAILGRDVDLVEREAVERSGNYLRRQHILRSLEPVYVA